MAIANKDIGLGTIFYADITNINLALTTLQSRFSAFANQSNVLATRMNQVTTAQNKMVGSSKKQKTAMGWC